MSDIFEPTARTQVKRMAARGLYDRAAIYAILDEGLVCHVGMVSDGQPYVIPMLHARVEDRLYVHGSAGSRLMQHVAEGASACITVTVLDGLVLARSAFHHSMNYRSVVMLAKGEPVTGREHKMEVFEGLVKRVIPGRWEEVRPPNESELDGTALVGFPIDECSAKVRTGPPKGDDIDHDRRVWAGVIPLSVTAGVPIADPHLDGSIAAPEYVRRYRRGNADA